MWVRGHSALKGCQITNAWSTCPSSSLTGLSSFITRLLPVCVTSPLGSQRFHPERAAARAAIGNLMTFSAQTHCRFLAIIGPVQAISVVPPLYCQHVLLEFLVYYSDRDDPERDVFPQPWLLSVFSGELGMGQRGLLHLFSRWHFTHM